MTGTNDAAATLDRPVEHAAVATYDVDADAYRATDDADGASPSETVVRTVAAVTDTDPPSLPSLYDSVDPDALDSLFSSPREVAGRVGRTTFEYADCVVTVASDGDVLVDPDAALDRDG